MAKTIAVIGALDTKGDEFLFVKKEIEKREHTALVINVGIVENPGFEPEVPADEVAKAGGSSLSILREKSDRGLAIETMSKGIVKVIVDLHAANRIQAVLSMGGSAGTEIGTTAMRALPLGVPKVMVSTLASGDTKPYVGTRDIVMVPSIVDVAGINRISARAYANAVGAVIGITRIPVRNLVISKDDFAVRVLDHGAAAGGGEYSTGRIGPVASTPDVANYQVRRRA